MDAEEVFVSPSGELALTKEYPPTPLPNIKQMSTMLERHRDELEQNPQKSVYMSFGNVTPSNMATIEKYREQSGAKFRRTNLPDIKTLLSKSSLKHENAYMNIGMTIYHQVVRMGIG